MFDIIGKKRWFFLVSLLITIPGLIFILLTPITNGAEGLKFSIDYTGGTEWSIKFKDANVTADQLRAELVVLGQDDATVTRTGQGFLDPAVMGPPIVWLASDEAAGVHDEPIIATEFEHWLRDRKAKQ